MSLKYPVPKPPTPTGYTLKSPRGAVLATRVWPNKQGTPNALCLLVHGGGWHSGYFEELAKVLTQEANLFVASYDHPGDGYSESEPDSPAHGVTHVRTFDWFIEDIFEAIDWMKKEANDSLTRMQKQNMDDIPVFLFGESFGGLQVIGAALDKDQYDTRIDGIIVSGGVIKVSPEFLPPAPVVKILVFLSKYYPKLIMPSTDFESTFDEAFGDKDWAIIARNDPKIFMAIKATLGSVAATLATGDQYMSRAKEMNVPMYAIHGKNDVRASCSVMEEFVDKVGPGKARMDIIETNGHQLLQDRPEISKDVIQKIKSWIMQQIAT